MDLWKFRIEIAMFLDVIIDSLVDCSDEIIVVEE